MVNMINGLLLLLYLAHPFNLIQVSFLSFISFIVSTNLKQQIASHLKKWLQISLFLPCSLISPLFYFSLAYPCSSVTHIIKYAIVLQKLSFWNQYFHHSQNHSVKSLVSQDKCRMKPNPPQSLFNHSNLYIILIQLIPFVITSLKKKLTWVNSKA